MISNKMHTYFPGTLYHVSQQAHNRSYIFQNRDDKQMILDLLVKLQQKIHFDLLYYVLMDNHFHFLICETETPLKRIMQLYKPALTRMYNAIHERQGTLYNRQYSRKSVETSDYFFQLIRYLAYNPVKAKICTKPSAYTWSAHINILRKNDRLLNIDLLLKPFDLNPKKAIRSYMNWVEKTDLSHVWVSTGKGCDIAPPQTVLHELLQNLDVSKTTQNLIRSRYRKPEILHMRRQLMITAAEKGLPLHTIAEFFSVSYDTVNKVLKNAILNQTPALALDDPFPPNIPQAHGE